MTATLTSTKPQESEPTKPESAADSTSEATDEVGKEESGISYGKVEALVIRELIVNPPKKKGEDPEFIVEYVNSQNNAKQVKCAPTLFKYMEEDKVTSMAKTKFMFFVNLETDVLEYIKPEPKNIYKLYNPEDQENERLDRELYTAPPEAS